MVLKGHNAPVRGLLWNTEIPYLLISGSWDYSMRVWDVRDGACLDTVLDHGADVYGENYMLRVDFIIFAARLTNAIRRGFPKNASICLPLKKVTDKRLEFRTTCS